MTDLEQRLRHELHEQAKRAVPETLRPLLELPAGGRPARRARWLVPAAAGTAVVLVLAGLVLAGRSLPGHGRPAGGAGELPGELLLPADPPQFAGLLEPAGLTMFSPVTGRAGPPFARVGISNGFALAPDSRLLFATSLVGRRLEIRSISVQTGEISFVADGAQPAVSPDSGLLAYTAGLHYTGLRIRDLATGVTRSIDLSGLIGSRASLLAGQLAWLGSGTQVVALPQPDPVATDPGSPSQPPAGAACGQQNSPRGLCLIVVDASPALHATPVYLPWAMLRLQPGDSRSVLISGLVTGQRTLLVGTSMVSSPVLATVPIIAAKASGQAAPLPLPPSAGLMAIAPDGDRVLYLTAQAGAARPALWVATPRDGRLDGRRRLFADTGKLSIDGAAW